MHDNGSPAANGNGIAEVVRTSSASPRSGASGLPKPPPAEASVIPGESEEDGLLRREYVLVGDGKAVEMTKAVDGKVSRFGATDTAPNGLSASPIEISNARRRPLRDLRMQPTPAPLVEDAMRNNYPGPDSPSPLDANTTFPPPPHPNAPPMSASPSSAGSRSGANALTRALSFASKKLLGTSNTRASPYYREYVQPSASPRKQSILSGRTTGLGLQMGGEGDPMENQLLESLEQLAQKTEVLTHWADEMYEYVKAIPQSEHLDEHCVSNCELTEEQFVEPLPDPSKFTRREGEPERQAAKRKNADVQAEYNAITCVALYMLLMGFSQNGVTKLVNYYEHLQMRDPEGGEVSEGFDEGQ